MDDRPWRWDEEEAAELLEGTEVMKRLLADMPAMREDHRRRVRSVSLPSHSFPFPLLAREGLKKVSRKKEGLIRDGVGGSSTTLTAGSWRCAANTPPRFAHFSRTERHLLLYTRTAARMWSAGAVRPWRS